MTVEVINLSSLKAPRKFIAWWTKEFSRWWARHGKGSLKDQPLVVVFLNDKEALRLNKKYRGRSKPTDILSFSGNDTEGLGELVLCSSVVRKQAKEHGLSLQMEVGYLIIHGILHLLGYEHENGRASAKEMYALQDAAFDFLRRKWHIRS